MGTTVLAKRMMQSKNDLLANGVQGILKLLVRFRLTIADWKTLQTKEKELLAQRIVAHANAIATSGLAQISLDAGLDALVEGWGRKKTGLRDVVALQFVVNSLRGLAKPLAQREVEFIALADDLLDLAQGADTSAHTLRHELELVKTELLLESPAMQALTEAIMGMAPHVQRVVHHSTDIHEWAGIVQQLYGKEALTDDDLTTLRAVPDELAALLDGMVDSLNALLGLTQAIIKGKLLDALRDIKVQNLTPFMLVNHVVYTVRASARVLAKLGDQQILNELVDRLDVIIRFGEKLHRSPASSSNAWRNLGLAQAGDSGIIRGSFGQAGRIFFVVSHVQENGVTTNELHLFELELDHAAYDVLSNQISGYTKPAYVRPQVVLAAVFDPSKVPAAVASRVA